ncbi:MAG: UDP-N-acetylmuramoyl-L-alanine--D-glutamate ligase [Eubacteriales bacterium]|nr:UDP-N-acetylmuramoyl-L-alanine--D-glutamate ligase [Eubacteriales bacterium]
MTEKGKTILEAVRTGRTAVLGMGVSNVPLAAFLLERSPQITLRDAKNLDVLPDGVAELTARGAKLRCGADYLSDLTEDVIFRSPGMRPDMPELAAASARGSILSSEAELFLELCPAHIIGITGSDGKTTTTTLTHRLLASVCAARGKDCHAVIGGNIGIPLIPLLSGLNERDYAVCELSSFQLQAAERSPEIAVITNIAPNHLNWHTDMDEYIRAKTNIFRSEPCRALITNAENAVTRALAEKATIPVTMFSSVCRPAIGSRRLWLSGTDLVLEDDSGTQTVLFSDVGRFLLPGKHNVENYMAACGALLAAGVSCAELTAAMEEVAPCFAGVEHRLEFIRELDGVRFYNSSIDSSPTRTAAALSVFPDGRNVVICGGSDKHIPFAPLALTLCRGARCVVLTGEAGPKIDAALAACPETEPSGLKILREPDFDSAVRLAAAEARPGERVLLSPACASFDAFPNFAVRGDRFRKLVCELS